MSDKHKAEQFEYLFVDIEWNQAPKTSGIEDREIIQIGIIAADEKINQEKMFDETIQLDNEETVLKEVKIAFPKYKYVVVWTNDTYELLKRRMDAYGYSMPRHKVILFQKILMRIASDGVNQVGFERALKQTGVEYQKKLLHCSKYDVSYMHRLFCTCYEEYTQKTIQENCYLNKRTHIMHTEECGYINGNHNTNLYKTTKNRIFQGHIVCKLCGAEENWNRLQWGVSSGIKRKKSAEYLKKLPLTDENISTICDKFHFDYNIAPGMVFIRTSFSRWIVHIENNIVIELQHENYKNKAYKKHMKSFEGYHKQKLPSERFYDVASYIKYHDDNMLQNLGKNYC